MIDAFSSPAIVHNQKPKNCRSDASRTLDPLDLLVSSSQLGSVENNWSNFNKKLNAAGFETCGMFVGDNNVSDLLKPINNKRYGTLLSNEYMEYAKSDPNQFQRLRAYRIIRQSSKPVIFLGEENFQHYSPIEKKMAKTIHDTFNVKAWALYAVHSPDKNRMVSFGWWDFKSQKEAKKLWDAQSANMILAATYFCESITPLIDKEEASKPVSLSPREKECLL